MISKIKEVKELAKMYGIKLHIKSLSDSIGLYNGITDTIYIDPALFKSKRNKVLSVFFHELGHSHCNVNRIYKQYHSYPKRFTQKYCRAVRLTGFRAECFVEKIGEQEFNKVYPHLKYEGFYGDEYSRQWLLNNFLDGFKW